MSVYEIYMIIFITIYFRLIRPIEDLRLSHTRVNRRDGREEIKSCKGDKRAGEAESLLTDNLIYWS